MVSSTVRIEDGPFADVDLIALGARTELMWRSPEITLVGVGESTVFNLSLAAESIAHATRELDEAAGGRKP